MAQENLVFNETGKVIGTFSPIESIKGHFANSAHTALNNKWASLRSEAREFNILNSIHSGSGMQPLIDYLGALMDWGDQKGAEAVIDKFHETLVI